MYAESQFFDPSAPIAHCVAWEERRRAAMIERRNRLALEAWGRRRAYRMA